MMSNNLPPACQRKFEATTNCIECGVWVDALLLLGEIAFCPQDASCSHHEMCASEAVRYATNLKEETPLRTRVLERLRHLSSAIPAST
jgi:hypothetical protein